jgi:sepiapterin reductase
MNLIIISGASQGLGKSIALEIVNDVRFFEDDTIIILAQRSSQTTKTELETSIKKLNFKHTISVLEFRIDFERQDIEDQVINMFKSINGPIEKAILFNNAGTLGSLTFVKDFSYKSILNCININLIGTMVLTSQFLKNYSICTIINISSLAAIQAFETWGMYSATKAGLDLFHQTIAKENKNARVLNYAPGPLNTAMQTKIRDDMPDIDLKKVYVDMHKNKQLIDPHQSAIVLLNIVLADQYESGIHIDYFDNK